MIAPVVAGAATLVFVGGGSASANQVAHYQGLYVYDDDNGNGLVGEIDRTSTTNNKAEKIDNDANGDRMRITAPYRDRAPGNARGVHTSVDWAKNGTYCYIAGIGISTTGGSAAAACSSGWNPYGDTVSPNIQDTAWWFSYHNKAYDLYSDSIRGALHICQEENTADPCSGNRFMGISY